MTHLFYYNVDIHSFDINKAYSLISTTRQHKADRIRSAQGKCTCIASELLLFHGLRHIGAKDTKIEYTYGPGGKPYLADSSIFFNISHSNGHIICAISDTEVGCDIEFVKAPNLKIADRFFHPDEYEYLRTLSDYDQTDEFYRIWTMKESYIKMTGEGLSAGLNTFSVLSSDLSIYFQTPDVTPICKVSVCTNSYSEVELQNVSVLEPC